MAKDPIVEEIHKIRAERLDEHGGIEGYIRHLDDLRVEFKDRIVHRKPRRPIITRQKAS